VQNVPADPRWAALAGPARRLLAGDVGEATYPRHPARTASHTILRKETYLSHGGGGAGARTLGSAHRPLSEAEAAEAEAAVVAAVDLDPAVWRRHLLTEAERAAFEADGYLVLAGALTEEGVRGLEAILGRVREAAGGDTRAAAAAVFSHTGSLDT
jgi:hypothetical protein